MNHTNIIEIYQKFIGFVPNAGDLNLYFDYHVLESAFCNLKLKKTIVWIKNCKLLSMLDSIEFLTFF